MLLLLKPQRNIQPLLPRGFGTSRQPLPSQECSLKLLSIYSLFSAFISHPSLQRQALLPTSRTHLSVVSASLLPQHGCLPYFLGPVSSHTYSQTSVAWVENAPPRPLYLNPRFLGWWRRLGGSGTFRGWSLTGGNLPLGRGGL